jgi:hypothetical protein
MWNMQIDTHPVLAPSLGLPGDVSVGCNRDCTGRPRVDLSARCCRAALVIPLLLMFIIVLGGCRASGGSQGSGSQAISSPTSPTVSPLDGLPTTNEKINRRPLAVMIENTPSARPQAGLDQASVVYEGITEGGITRFLAIYLENDPKVIGPVRSARPHFIYLAQGYDAAFVHCGESLEALEAFDRDPTIRNLDQMQYGTSFWRDNKRRKPHNLYTSSEKLRAAVTKLGWDGVANPPSFAAGPAITEGTAARDVTLRFGGAAGYDLRLVYDEKKGGYLRYMDGKAHVDAVTGKPLVMKNVIIQDVDAAPFADSKLETLNVTVLGGGSGYVLSNGLKRVITWQKDSENALTKYADYGGAPLPWQPGAFWVILLPRTGTISTYK